MDVSCHAKCEVSYFISLRQCRFKLFCEYMRLKCLQHTDSVLRSSNTGSLNIPKALKRPKEMTKLIENINSCLGLELEF